MKGLNLCCNHFMFFLASVKSSIFQYYYLHILYSVFWFRFLETGLYTDFNKIRMKLSELSSMQIHALLKKSQALERSVLNDAALRPEGFFFPDSRHSQQSQQQSHIATARQVQVQHQNLHPTPPGPPSRMFYPQHNRFFQCQSHHYRWWEIRIFLRILCK